MRASTVYKGIVRDGKVVLQVEGAQSALPEGTVVEIHIVESQQNFIEEESWRQRSEESWATIAWGAN